MRAARRSALAALLLAGAALAPGAQAQVMYNGWNLGPDYGAMVQGMLQQDRMLAERMRGQEAQVVQQAMQDPRAQTLYRQHRAQGGTLSFPQFAYQYAATGGFTPEGMRHYRDVENGNLARERQAWQGVQEAERQRAMAMQAGRDSYAWNQQEAGRVMQGQATWTDAATGRSHALPYLQPGQISRDPATGQLFQMDRAGTYYAQAPNGQWYPMRPGR